MSTFTESKTQPSPTRRNKSAIAEETLPFRVIESEELAQKLTHEQYCAVQSYRDVLIETALREKMNVDEITIAF